MLSKTLPTRPLLATSRYLFPSTCRRCPITTTPAQASPNAASSKSTTTTTQSTKAQNPADGTVNTTAAQQPQQKKAHGLTQAELDAQLMAKMAEMSGDGGEAGLEMEDGHVKGIGRGVKENMFRYI